MTLDLPLTDRPMAGEQLTPLALHLVESPEQRGHPLVDRVFLPLRVTGAGQKGQHRLLEVADTASPFTDHADGELGNVLGELVAQHLESACRVARDQDTLPEGDQVRDEVGDGVRLAGPWRSLDDHATMTGEPCDDPALLVIGGKREVDDFIFVEALPARVFLPVLEDLYHVADAEWDRCNGVPQLLEHPGVELDERALGALAQDERWGEVDLREVVGTGVRHHARIVG